MDPIVEQSVEDSNPLEDEPLEFTQPTTVKDENKVE